MGRIVDGAWESDIWDEIALEPYTKSEIEKDLGIFEEYAKLGLKNIGYNSDISSKSAIEFREKFTWDVVSKWANLGASEKGAQKKRIIRAYYLYEALFHIRGVKLGVEQKSLLMAVKSALRVAINVFAEEAIMGDRQKASGAKKTSENRKNVDRRLAKEREFDIALNDRTGKNVGELVEDIKKRLVKNKIYLEHETIAKDFSKYRNKKKKSIGK